MNIILFPVHSYNSKNMSINFFPKLKINYDDERCFILYLTVNIQEFDFI